MSFKKTKVVMLPTNEKATMALSGNKLSLKTKALQEESQHLYFLSDEEIKEGDWFWGESMINPEKAKTFEPHLINGFRKIALKKIIATTDSNLTIKTLVFVQGENKEIDVLLPEPSTSFIEKFVEEYNKGNVITEVLVEYEDKVAMDGHTIIGSELKISKDNTITIRKVKESWNRDEVVELLSKHFVDAGSKIGLGQDVRKFTKKWIEENL